MLVHTPYGNELLDARYKLDEDQDLPSGYKILISPVWQEGFNLLILLPIVLNLILIDL